MISTYLETKDDTPEKAKNRNSFSIDNVIITDSNKLHLRTDHSCVNKSRSWKTGVARNYKIVSLHSRTFVIGLPRLQFPSSSHLKGSRVGRQRTLGTRLVIGLLNLTLVGGRLFYPQFWNKNTPYSKMAANTLFFCFHVN